MGHHELTLPRTPSPLGRQSRGLVGAPARQWLVPLDAPVASGLVPEAIAAFLDASRPRSSDGLLNVPAKGPGLRDVVSYFEPDDPRLDFFDVVDGPVAEALADMPALEAPDEGAEPAADPGARMGIVRTLPMPRRVMPMAGAIVAAPAPRRRPRLAGQVPLALGLTGVLTAALGGGILLRDVIAAGPGVSSRPSTGAANRENRPVASASGLLAGLTGLFEDYLLGSPDAVELQEVGTEAGEMVAVAPGFGVLELVVEHDADVWIDGGPRGFVQGSGLFTLPTGDHDVEVRIGGGVESRSVEVAEGESVRLDLGGPAAG